MAKPSSAVSSAETRSSLNASPRPVMRVQPKAPPASPAAALLAWVPEVLAISVLVAVVAVVVSALV